MRVHSLCRALLLFLFSLLLVSSFCNGDDKTIFEVVGTGKCSNCKDNNFEVSQSFSGLYVTIDCKLKTGEIKRVGAGELDKQGSFKVSLPQHIVQQDRRTLKHECQAQLQSSTALPCPAHNGLEASKIVFKTLNKEKIIFGPTKPLQFSTTLCASKFFWHHFKCPPFFKPKQIPPPAPIYKPKPPVVKPLPPPTPVYKPKPKPNPKPPVVKPITPPKPNPNPPPVPVYKPKPKPGPKPKSPKKPPVWTKPMPPPFPLSPLPPFYKKPCPPFPKLPNFPLFPPKFGYLPPFPPLIPHP